MSWWPGYGRQSSPNNFLPVFKIKILIAMVRIPATTNTPEKGPVMNPGKS